MKKTSSKFILTHDELATKKNHTWSPTILKLIGATMDVYTMQQTCTYPTADGDLHQPETLISCNTVIEASCKGKLYRKYFNVKEDKTPIDMKMHIEVYPVRVEYLTKEEWKELKKEGIVDQLQIPKSAPALSPVERKNLEGAAANKK